MASSIASRLERRFPCEPNLEACWHNASILPLAAPVTALEYLVTQVVGLNMAHGGPLFRQVGLSEQYRECQCCMKRVDVDRAVAGFALGIPSGARILTFLPPFKLAEVDRDVRNPRGVSSLARLFVMFALASLVVQSLRVQGWRRQGRVEQAHSPHCASW